MNFPLITVGITCFNAELTIKRAVESALTQDWPNLEILVVDDCSSDTSKIILQELAAKSEKIKLIFHRHNHGAAAARNTLIKEALGEFICFFDDDDFSLSSRVSMQLNRILDYEQESATKLIACYVSGSRQYSNGYKIDLNAIGSVGSGFSVPNGSGLADYLLYYSRRNDWFYGFGVPTCALMARKTTFNAVGGFDEGLGRVEDVDFAVRLAMRGGHFIGVREKLFIQYSTISEDKSPIKNLESEIKLVEKNREYLIQQKRYYYALNWPKLRYWHFRRRYDKFLGIFIGLFIRNPIVVTKHFLSTGPKRLLHEVKMCSKRVL